MISNTSVRCYTNPYYQMNFSGGNPSEVSCADRFIADVKKISEQKQKGSKFGNLLWSPTAVLAGCTTVVGYELYVLKKVSNLKKLGNKEAIAAMKKAFIPKLLLVCAGSLILVAALQKLFNMNSDKKFDGMKKYFGEVNKTNAKLNDKTFRSGLTGAFYSSISGEVHLTKNLINDPWYNHKNKRLIKHELVHAKQFETVARMPDGIKKLNYAIMKKIVKPMQKPEIKAEFDAIYAEASTNTTGKYDNTILQLPDADVNFKDYITAVHTLLNNKNATYNDIPIVINQKYYQEAVDKLGPLTLEEVKKAEQYYQAIIDYPEPNAGNMLNPLSDYYNNLLEKEAYKENPWYTRII